MKPRIFYCSPASAPFPPAPPSVAGRTARSPGRRQRSPWTPGPLSPYPGSPEPCPPSAAPGAVAAAHWGPAMDWPGWSPAPKSTLTSEVILTWGLGEGTQLAVSGLTTERSIRGLGKRLGEEDVAWGGG